MHSRSKQGPARLHELPVPPAGRSGWPWTEEGPELMDALPDGRPWPEITIVTPTSGSSVHLEETIRSVVLQRYPNFEYIVVDSGNSAESAAIIRKYKPWISTVAHEPQLGRVRAINRGLRLASGEIFNWVNRGDMLAAGALGIIGRSFDGVDVVAGGRILLSDAEHPRHLLLADLSSQGMLLMRPGSKPQQLATWVRRSEMVLAGALDEQLSFTSLTDFYIRYLHLFPRIKYANVIFGWARKRGFAEGERSDRALEERLRIVEKLRMRPEFRELWPDCDYAREKYEWWLHVSRIANESNISGLQRAIRIMLATHTKARLRWDDVTKRTLRRIVNDC